MTNCKCLQSGYCKSLGRNMPEARWRECHTQPAFCEMYHAEAAAGKYKAERYQRPYDPNDDVPARTPIELSSAQKARNFARATPALLSGQRTKKHERAEREAICNGCEFVKGDWCAICGCQLALKRKIAKQSCPVLKWEGDRERFNWNEKPKTFAAGVTTCQRDEPTLNDSLDSIRAAGFSRLSVIEDKNRDGAWNTFRRGLAQILASNPSADAYLMFQDDVQVAENACKYLLANLWPDGENTGVVSLYCCGLYRHNENGWHQRNGTTWGALALCFTPLSARLFVADTKPRQKGAAVIEKKVANWCNESGMSYWVHSPSLVQHTGSTSTISGLKMGSTRRAKTFCEDAALLVSE